MVFLGVCLPTNPIAHFRQLVCEATLSDLDQDIPRSAASPALFYLSVCLFVLYTREREIKI